MTKSRLRQAWSSQSKNERDKDLFRILTLLKDRENDRLPIFYPKANSFKDEKGRIPSLVWVEKKLFSGKYSQGNRIWRFIQDVHEAFDYILNQHTKKSKRFQIATRLLQDFTSQMEMYMEELGYCCGRWYCQKARLVACSGAKNCFVEVDMIYYRYREWTFCTKCFTAFAGNTVVLTDNSIVNKSEFNNFLCSGAKSEKFVVCSSCHLAFHEICVLYQRLTCGPFLCRKCRDFINVKPPSIRAAKLPTTDCDRFIMDFLAKEFNIKDNDSMTIRLLSNAEKTLRVKQRIANARGGAIEYSYRNCTLFTFFDTGCDSDICFLAIFFQLYGEDCPEPNRNAAYISYIDSVNLLPVSTVRRTFVYRIILLGLIAYLKQQGFTKVFLWSCPPNKDNDYVFHVKPAWMKIPNKDRLAKWYEDLFKMGLKSGVIKSFQGIQKYAEQQGLRDIRNLPYMEGDLWITRMEEAVTMVDAKEAKMRKELSALQATIDGAKNLTNHVNDQKMNALIRRQQECAAWNKKAEVWELMEVQLRGFNSVYFVIHLEKPANVQRKQNDIERDWLNDRQLLVDFFYEFLLEFRDERSAKFSTQSLLYRIFADGRICIQCATEATALTPALLCEDCVVRMSNDFNNAIARMRDHREHAADDSGVSEGFESSIDSSTILRSPSLLRDDATPIPLGNLNHLKVEFGKGESSNVCDRLELNYSGIGRPKDITEASFNSDSEKDIVIHAFPPPESSDEEFDAVEQSPQSPSSTEPHQTHNFEISSDEDGSDDEEMMSDDPSDDEDDANILKLLRRSLLSSEDLDVVSATDSSPLEARGSSEESDGTDSNLTRPSSPGKQATGDENSQGSSVDIKMKTRSYFNLLPSIGVDAVSEEASSASASSSESDFIVSRTPSIEILTASDGESDSSGSSTTASEKFLVTSEDESLMPSSPEFKNHWKRAYVRTRSIRKSFNLRSKKRFKHGEVIDLTKSSGDESSHSVIAGQKRRKL